ncbi:MAG: bifunctional homocysteine S-methyltransferase/methylenetetrahydrofolate reductase [bacterium]|nr:bifunctional homocysteine S-methyltransferase/methylenetetrahydrofolate reductase [bacterium]
MQKSFLDALEEGVLVCDGAMGTMLYAKGIYINRNFDELNLSAPELVQRIHRDYLDAGAEILETNTFGANRYKLAAFGLEHKVAEINQAGVKLAKEIAGDTAFVAGSVGPLGKFVEPRGPISIQEAKSAFQEQITALAQSGADIIILETFADLFEIKLAVLSAKEVCSLPIIAQMAFTEEGVTAAGFSPEEVVTELESLAVAVVGVNCSAGPQPVLDVIERMAKVRRGKLSAQPNAGQPQMIDGRFLYLASPEYLAEYARRYVTLGVSIVGGCCGTTPDHIRAVKAMVKMLHPPKAKPIPITATPIAEAAKPVVIPAKPEEKSAFGKKLGKKFVISVELDPPRGTDPKKVIDGANALYQAGIDAINVADSPRAMARMNPISLCRLIQEQVGIETIVHVTTRDRNLLGLQSDLIGAFALGLHNILAVTGDPPKLGDYPNATAVYDVDSIGLVQIIRLLNQGQDLAGNNIIPATKFLIGVGANPGAPDLEKEIERFEKKVNAGAEFALTQPVYEIKMFENFLKRIDHLKIPILVGILPLRSYKHAEFLHNEVPGMSIPDKIRERIRLAGDNAPNEGIKIAQEALLEAKSMVAGAYLMPPFNKYEIALEVLQVL